MNTQKTDQTKTTSQPNQQLSMTMLEASALKLIRERILSKGGKMPSLEAVTTAAKMLASKAMRESK